MDTKQHAVARNQDGANDGDTQDIITQRCVRNLHIRNSNQFEILVAMSIEYYLGLLMSSLTYKCGVGEGPHNSRHA